MDETQVFFSIKRNKKLDFEYNKYKKPLKILLISYIITMRRRRLGVWN